MDITPTFLFEKMKEYKGPIICRVARKEGFVTAFGYKPSQIGGTPLSFRKPFVRVRFWKSEMDTRGNILYKAWEEEFDPQMIELPPYPSANT